jgi:hypothetical protein
MNTKLYSHTTDGGAEYLCTDHIDGCNEGDLTTAVIRLDGGAEFLSPVYAAAPDLLEACQHLRASLQWQGGVRYIIKDADLEPLRAAIAKATGE